MNENESTSLLKRRGVRPTPNRIIIAGELAGKSRPVSLHELEDSIVTIDRSSIFRTLNVFKEHGVVHVIEDGSDSVKYELCKSSSNEEDDDEHVHFYCQECHRTVCMDCIHIPQVTLPAGYERHSVNYLIKGVCPACARKLNMA